MIKRLKKTYMSYAGPWTSVELTTNIRSLSFEVLTSVSFDLFTATYFLLCGKWLHSVPAETRHPNIIQYLLLHTLNFSQLPLMFPGLNVQIVLCYVPSS